MREYTPKNNVQKKSYYTDRFWVPTKLPKDDVTNDYMFQDDLEKLAKSFEIKDAYIQAEQLVICVNYKDNKAVIKFFRDELEYDILTEMSAVDWLEQKCKFEVFYQLLSISKRKRARVKIFIKEDEVIQSVESVFRSADWAEREMYDMFGIKVINHPYFKRILMPDDWQGHPLLKSYPLQGDEFAQWYEVDKIFGKEAREVIGPENRDGAMVDRFDTKKFARLGKEVEFGGSIEDEQTQKETPVQYQEENGVPLVTTLNTNKSKILKERK